LWGTIAAAYGIALLEQLAIGVPLFGFYIPAGYQSTVALVTIIVASSIERSRASTFLAVTR
jgi:hypothetical protein